MGDLFKKEWWEVIVILATLGSVLFGGAYYVIKAFRDSKVRLQKTLGGFSLSTDDTGFQSPHSTCPHVKDIILLMQLQHDTLYKKDFIEMVEIMREQMKYTEEHLEQLTIELKRDYLENLKMYTNNTGVNFSSKEYKYYSVITDLIEEKTLPMFRKIYRENHFAEKSELEFQMYRKEKAEMLFSIWTDNYQQLSLLSGSETSEDFQKRLRGKVLDVFLECIGQARKVALEKREDIAALDKQLKDTLQKYLGC